MATEKNIIMKQFNGTDYDTLYPKTKLEQVEGAYTQQQILSDSTKALYGLGNNAVPDDVFSWIAQETPRIETGSYVGTGTESPNNKNSLTFSFNPKFVVIWKDDSIVSWLFVFTVEKNTYSIVRSSGTITSTHCTFDGKTLLWWTGDDSSSTSGSASNQANESGVTYDYVAFG